MACPTSYACRLWPNGSSAARGGVGVAKTVFEQPAYLMQDGPQRYAWYAGTESSNNELNGIGLLKPNPLGLYDMLGNAGEFVLDAYRHNKHSRLVVVPSSLPSKGRLHSVRTLWTNLKVDQFTTTHRSEQSVIRLTALAGGFSTLELFF